MSSNKSFKDNPALNFISPPAKPQRAPAPPKSPDKIGPASAAPLPAETPVPMKPNPLYVETKSKRVQLLMQPSLHRQLKARAEAGGQSLNDLIHTVLADWVDS